MWLFWHVSTARKVVWKVFKNLHLVVLKFLMKIWIIRFTNLRYKLRISKRINKWTVASKGYSALQKFTALFTNVYKIYDSIETCEEVLHKVLLILLVLLYYKVILIRKFAHEQSKFLNRNSSKLQWILINTWSRHPSTV